MWALSQGSAVRVVRKVARHSRVESVGNNAWIEALRLDCKNLEVCPGREVRETIRRVLPAATGSFRAQPRIQILLGHTPRHPANLGMLSSSRMLKCFGVSHTHPT